MRCKAHSKSFAEGTDSYTVAPSHLHARKPFRIRTCEKRRCKSSGIRTYRIIGLKIPWNQHLQKRVGVGVSRLPPFSLFTYCPASLKAARKRRALTHLAAEAILEAGELSGSACEVTPSAASQAMHRVYFDHNATTPVDRRVLEAMLPFFADEFGNASSIHSFGQRTRAAVGRARAERPGLRARLAERELQAAAEDKASAAVAAATSGPGDPVVRLRRSVVGSLEGATVSGARLAVSAGRSPVGARVQFSAEGRYAEILRLAGHLVRPGTGLAFWCTPGDLS